MKITVEDFANSFGTTAEEVRRYCLDKIDKSDFSYEVIAGDKKDKLVLNILKRIDDDKQIIGAPERKEAWNKGWDENLKDFINSNYDLEKLTPRFIRNSQPVRYNSQYIETTDPKFELDYYVVYREWLFKKYLLDYDNVYEFGCGTGFNLVALSKLSPKINLYGLDFVKSSADLVNEIARVHKLNMEGCLFDMVNSNKDVVIKSNSGVFTVGAVEQLGGKFYDFIKYLIQNRPAIVVHTEPVEELYDTNRLEDYLAYKFQHKRGYTSGLLPYLKKLEADGKIKIEKVKRLYFGSLFMEGYNLIVWKPL